MSRHTRPFVANAIILQGVAVAMRLGLVIACCCTLPAYAILPSLLDVPPEMLVNEPPVTKTTKTPNASPSKVILHKAPIVSVQKPLPIAPPEPASAIPLTANQPSVATTPTDTTLATAMATQHQAINNMLRDQEADSLADVGVLWQTAVERSGTIRFAIEKLSRKNAVGVDPNDTDFSKRLIQSLARVGGAASTMMTGTPAGLVGGSIVNDLVQGNPKQSPLSIVTDADMLLLAKEVEALQSQLLTSYYTYRHAKERLALAQQGQQEIQRYQELLNPSDSGHKSDPLWGPLAGTLTAGLDDALIKTQQEYLSARQNLSLLVGMETLESMEKASKSTAAATVGSQKTNN
ncbi:MAG: hypothetical protein QE263_09150 [Vampirovibrionales bacterium]|nr:hypothetical protein [Vampirovibrionales bacterium]